MVKRVLSVALAVALAGCHGGAAAPRDAATSVDPREDVCQDGGVAAPDFAIVQRIFDENCVSCHNGASNMVNLMAGAAWTNLVNQLAPPPDTCGGPLVTPGDPGASYLYVKLTSPTPCYGAQMPRSEFSSVPLPACVIDIVRAWIAEGAPGPATDGAAD